MSTDVRSAGAPTRRRANAPRTIPSLPTDRPRQGTSRRGGAAPVGDGAHAPHPAGAGSAPAGTGAPAPARTGTLSTTSIVFMIIAASAPLTVLAGGVPTAYGVSGLLGVPLAFLVLGAVFAVFSIGFGRMASSIRNAGALYAFVTEGLGVRQGIAAADALARPHESGGQHLQSGATTKPGQSVPTARHAAS